MAEKNNLRYLDEHGLQVLADEGFLAPHPGKPGASAKVDPAAVKIGRDDYGHVVIGDKLKYTDLTELPTIGNGELVVKRNGVAIGTFAANQDTDLEIDINVPTTPDDINAAAPEDIGDGRLTIQVNGTQKGAFTANQKSDLTVNITAEDFGLSKALTFIGKTTSSLTDDSANNSIEVNGELIVAEVGNVVLYADSEFVWTGSNWEELGGVHGTEVAGKHDHTVTATIPAATYIETVTPDTTKLSLDKKTQAVITEIPGTYSKLSTTTITGVNGTVTASKAKAGANVNVATTGVELTVATKAKNQTTIGNADVGDEITITGVSGSVTASKATAGTAMAVAAVGTSAEVATRAADQTLVGNADIGEQITVTGVKDITTTASKVNTQTSVAVATTDTAVEVAVKAATATTVATGIESATTTAYMAEYDEATEVLMLTPATVTIVPTTTSIFGVGSTTSITPAKANGNINSYTFTDVAVPVKDDSAQVFNSAKAVSTASTKIYGVGGVTTVTSAQAGGTITPYTFEEVTVPRAAEATTFNAAKATSEASTKIYGVADEVTFKPAVDNGVITPYTFEDVVAAKKADTATTVATGALNAAGAGAEIMTGVGTLATASVLLDSTAVKTGVSGDVEVVSNIRASKNTTATSINGTTAEAGEHEHTVV